MRSQSFEEEFESSNNNNRRQLPNVPKKPARQSSHSRDNSNREPTPDYDSAGDHKTEATKSSPPLASSPVKKQPPESSPPGSEMKTDEDSSDQNANKNQDNLRGKLKTHCTIWHEKSLILLSSFPLCFSLFVLPVFSGFGL